MPVESGRIAGGLAISRRAVLGGGAALAAISAGPALAAATPAPRTAIGFAIGDARYAESQQFTRFFAGQGVEALNLADGFTSMWSQKLVPFWREPGGIVAGLTTRAAWDGLSHLALGQFRKPRLLGIHRFGGSAATVHSVGLPSPLSEATGFRENPDEQWPARMATVVQDCVKLSALPALADVSSMAAVGPAASNELLSWIIE